MKKKASQNYDILTRVITENMFCAIIVIVLLGFTCGNNHFTLKREKNFKGES